MICGQDYCWTDTWGGYVASLGIYDGVRGKEYVGRISDKRWGRRVKE